MALSRYGTPLAADTGLAAGGWRARAACRNSVKQPEDDLWFAPTAMHGRAEPDLVARVRVQAAKQICTGCLVRTECLAFALTSGQRHGVWGGLSEAELAALRRGARHPAVPVTGEVAG